MMYDQEYLIDQLKKRSAELNGGKGYNKKDMRIVFELLEDILFDTIASTTQNDPVEIKMWKGFYVGGKYMPTRNKVNPQNQNEITCDETVLPYVHIKDTWKNKIHKKFKG